MLTVNADIVHRPTFVKRYTAFWASPPTTSDMDWLALLFMVLSLGIFFSSFSTPHELANDATSLTPMQRFRQYRAAAGHALTTSSRSGGYSSPATSTCAPFLLYVESEFLINRSSHMNCYLLAGVCIRIMLKMGLHRDPSKLPGAQISPYDGEMRRRMWNLAVQIDLMVSFHLGLPSMIHGIESDTSSPGNLLDEDFGEDTVEMPPERVVGDYTHMTYPIFKASICRVFGKVARMAHALTVPTHGEVMAVDALLEARWASIPSFMKVRPLHTCIADPPFQVVQRFGIAALYQKARCVLHRQFLAEKDPKPAHDYSRRACLLGALALLEYQNSVSEATKPGGMLSGNGWFVSSLAIHDFLLAATIVYLVIKNDHYNEPGRDFDLINEDTPLPNKQQLMASLRRSHRIWVETSAENPEVKKAPAVLEVMLRQIGQHDEKAPREKMGFAMANFSANGQSSCPERLCFDAARLCITSEERFPSPLMCGAELTRMPEASSPLATTVTVSPRLEVPFSQDGFMKAPMTVHPGADTGWLPEEMDAVDWVRWCSFFVLLFFFSYLFFLLGSLISFACAYHAWNHCTPKSLFLALADRNDLDRLHWRLPSVPMPTWTRPTPSNGSGPASHSIRSALPTLTSWTHDYRANCNSETKS